MTRLLLDTHALLWFFIDPDRLTPAAADAIADRGRDVAVSAVSAYELSLKHRLGKLDQAAKLLRNFDADMAENGFRLLELGHDHALAAGGLPLHHRDPFDRLLIAQASAAGLTLISNERLFDRYGVDRLW